MRPVVNCEEFIGKTVGRRRASTDSLSQSTALQRTLGTFYRPAIKKGVYRFHSHEEADQWLMDRLIRKPGS
jgi:hypothetical protein